jgi:hypothetical protein
MIILYTLAREVECLFPPTNAGRERFQWFVLPLHAILVPITISPSSNLPCAIMALFIQG